MHNNIFSSATHTNPIARLAVITFQPYKKTIKLVEKVTNYYRHGRA